MLSRCAGSFPRERIAENRLENRRKWSIKKNVIDVEAYYDAVLFVPPLSTLYNICCETHMICYDVSLGIEQQYIVSSQ